MLAAGAAAKSFAVVASTRAVAGAATVVAAAAKIAVAAKPTGVAGLVSMDAVAGTAANAAG